MSDDYTWADEDRLTYEELEAGEPCRNCGRPFFGGPEWLAVLKRTPEQAAAFEAEEVEFKTLHPDCKAMRWTISGGGVEHCARCCAPPPMSPETTRRVAELLVDMARADVMKKRNEERAAATRPSEVELPFASYPEGGRSLLGRASGDTARRGYGLAFMKKTGQTTCAYCGLDLVNKYESWLQLALDHVVPESVCRGYGLPNEWTHDSSNKVLACAACNGFRNRYRQPADAVCPTTLDEFFDLRDRIFAERKALILDSHESEREFFQRRPWEKE
jgi:hypothetical protein